MPGFTVLHVEDEPEDRIFVADAFKRVAPALALRSVQDGEQAVAYLSGVGPFADRTAHPTPDLVLLDLKLPRRSGFEVLDWIRRSSDCPQLPVFVLTSSSEPRDIEQAYALGATSYLVKSLDLKSTRELVRALGAYAGLLSK